MAKAPTGSSSNSTKTKAGKKSGAYIAPPAANSDNRAAKEQGQSQFTAKQFPAPLPAVKGSWDAAMDALCRHYGVKRVRRNQVQDNGYRWDTKRKQVIAPPNRRVDR